MKHPIKITLFALALSSLWASAGAQAVPSTDAAPTAKQEPTGEPKNCDRWDRKEQRLETLKADLKLNPSQQAAWTEWVGKVQGDRQGFEEKRKAFESWESLPAPERLEKQLAFSKEHVAKLEASLVATKAFYAQLSPEQRQIFDKGFNFGHRGGFGKHWKR